MALTTADGRYSSFDANRRSQTGAPGAAPNPNPEPSGTPAFFARLEGRQHVLALQRRRFWRELAFAGAMLSADALTIAVIFVMLAQLPLSHAPQHLEFASGLIPPNPAALLRRVTSLLLCLAATRSYTTSTTREQPGRIGLAILLGIVLPRWPELWTALLLSRTLLVTLVVVVLWLTLVVQRRGMSSALHAFDPRRLDQEHTLLVGMGPQIIIFLNEQVDSALAPPEVYILDPAWPGERQEGWESLYEQIHLSHADTIILVGPLSDEALQSVLIAGSSAGCRVFGLRRRPLREMNNPTFTRQGQGPMALLSSPALIGWQLVAKRILDVTGATVGIVLLSPVMAVCAALVKFTTPGPVIFRQIRVGLGGENFQMLKLRTMVRDADERADEVMGANVYQEQTLFKAAGDPRITRVGRFLRRSSLDELPQLWNVLRGEMSLVGPRPPLPREVARYGIRHFVRFEVAPGITGPWQVSGRNDITSFEHVVQLEQAYIAGWTVWRDLILLLRTIPAVLSMRGAL